MSIKETIKSSTFQFISIIATIIIATVGFTIGVENRYVSQTSLIKTITDLKADILSGKILTISQIVDGLKEKGITGKLAPHEQIKLDNMKEELSLIKRKLADYDRLDKIPKALAAPKYDELIFTNQRIDKQDKIIAELQEKLKEKENVQSK